MFARDHFHPSGAGYGRAMDAMLPTVITQLKAAVAKSLPRHVEHDGHSLSA